MPPVSLTTLTVVAGTPNSVSNVFRSDWMLGSLYASTIAIVSPFARARRPVERDAAETVCFLKLRGRKATPGARPGFSEQNVG